MGDLIDISEVTDEMREDMAPIVAGWKDYLRETDNEILALSKKRMEIVESIKFWSK